MLRKVGRIRSYPARADNATGAAAMPQRSGSGLLVKLSTLDIVWVN
jgi:hypothetical protein